MKNLFILLFVLFATTDFVFAQGADCGISAFLEPGEPSDNSKLVQVSLRNYGTTILNTVNIHTIINGLPKRTYNYRGPALAPGKKIDLYLVSHRFNMNATYNFEFYTSNPNGMQDSNTANDTLRSTLKGALDLEDNDAGIVTITAPTVISEGSKLVRVRLKNFGIDPIENVQIAWRVNGVEQRPYQYIGPPLRSRREIDLYIGRFNFKEDGTEYIISARVIMPNGKPDQKPSNDRAVREY